MRKTAIVVKTLAGLPIEYKNYSHYSDPVAQSFHAKDVLLINVEITSQIK